MLFPNKQIPFLSYSKEITLALLVKFLLLGALWWLFFSGNKQSVDGEVIAEKIFGGQHSATIPQQNKGGH